MKKQKLVSPIKYTGGKQKHFDKFAPYIPSKVSVFGDVFLGGGGFALRFLDSFLCEKAYLNDKSKNIIQMFREIHHNPYYITEEIGWLDYRYKDSYKERYKWWYDYKKIIELDITLNAAKLIYFNVLSFNGYIAPKSKWSFNHLIEFDVNNKTRKINKAHDILNKNSVELSCGDYKEIVEKIESLNDKDSFIYFDPPYLLKNTNQYYSAEGFDVYSFFEYIKTLKTKWMLSINDMPKIREIFKDFVIVDINLKYSNIAFKTKLQRTNELLIMNYKKEEEK